MAIESKTLPYPDFVVNEILDPQEFDDNNATLVNAINEIIAKLNVITDSITDAGSGADNVALTAIDAFTSTTVQGIIEELNTQIKSVVDSASGADYVGATEIAGVTGTTVQTILENLKTLLDSAEGEGRTTESIKGNADNLAEHAVSIDNPHGVTAEQIGAYTQLELQGAGTAQVNWENISNVPNLTTTGFNEEIFVVKSIDTDAGTFTYQDGDENLFTGTIDDSGRYIFEVSESYSLALNQMTAYIDDALYCSVTSGGLYEVDNTHVALTNAPEIDSEITIRYIVMNGFMACGVYANESAPVSPDQGVMWLDLSD